MADMTEEEKAARLNDLGDFNSKNADFIAKLNQEAEVFTEDGPEDMQDHTGPNHPLVNALWSRESLPTGVDWRDYGAVSPVLSQGSCGSCWAFASAGVLEGALAIKTNTTAVHLSAQQILDCVKDSPQKHIVSKDCEGGIGSEVFEYFKDNYINEAEKYPYRGRGLECRQSGLMTAPTPEPRNWFARKLDYVRGRDTSLAGNLVPNAINVKKHFMI